MSNKVKILFLSLLILMMSFASGGCGTENDPDSGLPGGGKTETNTPIDEEPSLEDIVNYEIIGASDLFLTLSATAKNCDFSFVSGIMTVNGASSESNVTIDLSQIRFGESGVYEIIYRLGDEEKKNKVYIYDSQKPTVTGNVPLTISEEEAEGFDARSGISVTDKFGFNVTVYVSGILNGGNSLQTLQIGDNTVIMKAVDVVGNELRFERTITVE